MICFETSTSVERKSANKTRTNEQVYNTHMKFLLYFVLFGACSRALLVSQLSSNKLHITIYIANTNSNKGIIIIVIREKLTN